MTLPILLVLLVGLVWAGRVSIARATTAVDSRRDAWNARHNVRHEPFDFSDTTAGIATASAERTVAFTWPALSFTPQASVSVHGDPWGFRTLDMNRPPDWRLMTTALQKAGENRVDQITTITDGLKRSLDDLLAIEPSLPELDMNFGTFDSMMGPLLDSLPKGVVDGDTLSAEGLDAAISEAEKQIVDLKTSLDGGTLLDPERAVNMLKAYENILQELLRRKQGQRLQQ